MTLEDPLVTLNILSFNRKADLRITLGHVFAQDYAHIEVIVVDNASTDGSAEMVEREFPRVILLRRDRNNGIAGWNEGFRIARGTYYCVLDDDCHIEGDTIRKTINCFQTENVDIVSYNVIDPRTRYSYTLYAPAGIFSFWGCAVMMKRSVIDELGGFDENIFLYHHEAEFMLRAMKKGFTHRKLITEQAFHRKDPSNQPYDQEKMKLHLYSLEYSYLKHLRGRKYLRMLFYYLLESLIVSMRSIKKYHTWSLFPFAALYAALRNASSVSQDRSEYDGGVILENDVNCINPLLRVVLRKWSNDAERNYLCRYMKERSDFYPDYIERYFLRRVPFETATLSGDHTR